MTRDEVAADARSYVGTPYRHQGRKKGRAIDCIGLVWGVASDLGYVTTIPANYAQSPSSTMLIRECEKHLVKVERTVDEARVGDILVLWGLTRNEAQHFAIVGEVNGRLTMIHAFSKRGEVVEHGIDDFWKQRLVAIYNFPGLED